jgi:hypothetical protein
MTASWPRAGRRHVGIGGMRPHRRLLQRIPCRAFPPGAASRGLPAVGGVGYVDVQVVLPGPAPTDICSSPDARFPIISTSSPAHRS